MDYDKTALEQNLIATLAENGCSEKQSMAILTEVLQHVKDYSDRASEVGVEPEVSLQNAIGEIMGLNERTIWSLRQNHPELVVKDCQKEFGLTEPQCERLRQIMMERGINKWLLARRKFIALKHDMKTIIPELQKTKEVDGKMLRKEFLSVYNQMQRICKMPRWVEWARDIHHDMGKNEKLVIVRGKHC